MFEKQIQDLKNKWYTVTIYQEIKQNRLDSFWYHWDIASISKDWKEVVLSAHWEIQINECDNWIIYIPWMIDQLPFDFSKWTDSDLMDMDNEKYDFVFNNWFSVYNIDTPNNDEVLDSIEYFLDEE